MAQVPTTEAADSDWKPLFTRRQWLVIGSTWVVVFVGTFKFLDWRAGKYRAHSGTT